MFGKSLKIMESKLELGDTVSVFENRNCNKKRDGGYYEHYNGSNMICQEHLWGEGTTMFSLIVRGGGIY